VNSKPHSAKSRARDGEGEEDEDEGEVVDQADGKEEMGELDFNAMDDEGRDEMDEVDEVDDFATQAGKSVSLTTACIG
jgi:hypothetical protein